MQVQNGPIASSGQIAVNANIPQRISPIDEAMSSLRSTQNATFQLLEELASRLEPVLQAEPPCSKKDANGEPSASQLHGEILQRSSAATDIHARIRGLIERLTV